MKYYQLTENERYQIYIMNKAGHSQKEIADHLGRHPSTISRELSRNKGLRGYRPDQAQRFSDDRRQSAYKHRKLTEPVTEWIDKLLRQELSPQQIVAYLKISSCITKQYTSTSTQTKPTAVICMPTSALQPSPTVNATVVMTDEGE